jgi:hypothetical protein
MLRLIGKLDSRGVLQEGTTNRAVPSRSGESVRPLVQTSTGLDHIQAVLLSPRGYVTGTDGLHGGCSEVATVDVADAVLLIVERMTGV